MSPTSSSSSVTSGSLVTPVFPDFLGVPDQPGVRRASPRGVDGAMEVADAVDPRAVRGRRHLGVGAITDSSTTGPPADFPFPKPSPRVVVGDLRRRTAVGNHGTPRAGVRAVAATARRWARRTQGTTRPPPATGPASSRRRSVGCRRAASSRPSVSTALKSGLSLPPMCRQRPALVVEQHQLALLDVAVERERQVDDRILQALAHPDRHDLHPGGITVQAADCVRLCRRVLSVGRAASPAAPARRNPPRCAVSAAVASRAPSRSYAARRPATTALGHSCRLTARPRRWQPPRAHGRGPPTAAKVSAT